MAKRATKQAPRKASKSRGTSKAATAKRPAAKRKKNPGARPRIHQSCLLGLVIERMAKARGLTLPDLAAAVGITSVGMNDIRRGRFRPRLDTLERISDVLEVAPGRLLSR